MKAMTRSWRVASVLFLAWVVASCASTDERALDDGDTRTGQEIFCNAAGALAVGAPLPTPNERIAILRTMHAISSTRWKAVIGAAIESVENEADMSPRWDSDLVGLVEYIESACELNIPQFEPRERTD